MFRHFLIGFDGSPHSKKALERGIDLALSASAELTIVTAFPKIPDYLGSPQYDQQVESATQKAQQLAEMAAEQAHACGLEKVRLEVIEGQPAECILTVAETRGCDCIVVGSHGREGIVGLLLGSVSDRLAHHAKVPVLIVK